MIPSINFHLWQACNYRCKFCFAQFQDVKSTVLPKGHLPKEQAIHVVKQIIDHGFKKITFVGGEPLLCPWLSELITIAKKGGLTTMIVTNGHTLKKEWLEQLVGKLDWVTLSIDSINPDTLLETGRHLRNNVLTDKDYLERAKWVKEAGMRLKVNTVVTEFNYSETLASFIQEIAPERWKIFQVLPIEGQNDKTVEPLLINQEKFSLYIENNRWVEQHGIPFIPETNDDMKESYLMIDPAGRFFDNSQGTYIYSQSIQEIGLKKALQFINVSATKFETRGGLYDWK